MPDTGMMGQDSGAKEVDALVLALNRTAERLQTLWFTFLTFTLYLAIAAGTTTHRMLFLEEGLTLPILDVKLPLLGFYVVAPVFFVIFHAYFLMMLVLLARLAEAFERALRKAVPMRAAQERHRMRLENAIFLQLLSGALRERKGRNRAWLRLIATLTLAVLPIVLLLMIQIMFLPYHHNWMTWLHRALIIFDLALIWTLWPAFLYEGGARLLPRLKNYRRNLVNFVLSFLVLIFSITIMTWPGELMNRLGVVNQIGLSTFLFGGENPVQDITLDLRGLFPNRLWLPNEFFADTEKLKQVAAETETGAPQLKSYILSLANRDLGGAVLIGADLRNADFKGAVVANASFREASLQSARLQVKDGAGADFNGAQLQGASLVEAQLQGAWLIGAQLRWAKLNGTNMQGAKLDEAQLEGANMQGAKLDEVQLRGAWLIGAQLQGASLNGAQLLGTKLKRALMQGANLEGAWMQGSSLNEAQLQGAKLDGARMQGASLDKAQLQGASLVEAQLQGASLDKAQLQGASLERAQLQGASLKEADVWRTHGAPANLEVADQSKLYYDEIISRYVFWDSIGKENFPSWRETTLDVIPQGEPRDAAAGRLAVLDPAVQMSDGLKDLIQQFSKALKEEQKRQSKQAYDYPNALNTVLKNLSCDGENAPYVARGLIENGRLKSLGMDYLAPLAERLEAGAQAKSEEKNKCPGAIGLNAEDLKNLRTLVEEVKEESKPGPAQ